MLARVTPHAGALYLFAATTVANVLGYGYQVVMARLLRPEDYAVLTALFGILILESISSQVIQSATAKLAAQYRARSEEAALHAFVRRWAVRVGGGAAAVGLLVGALSGLILEDDGRLQMRLGLIAPPDDPARPWRVPLALRLAFRFEPARAMAMRPNELAETVLAGFVRAIEGLGRP